MKINPNYYVPLPNQVIDGDSRLPPEELYLLSILYTHGQYRDWDSVFINVDLLASEAALMHNQRANENKKRIKGCLLAMRSKAVIKIHAAEDFSYSEPLLISLALGHPSSKEGRYTQITPWFFEQTNEPLKFMILVIIQRYSTRDPRISDSQFAKLTGRTEKTVRNARQALEHAGIIHVEHGDLYRLAETQQVRREKNRFKLSASDTPDDARPTSKPQPAKAMNLDQQAKAEGEARKHNWFSTDKKVYIDDYDYYVYLTTSSETLSKHAERRLAKIRESETGSKNMARAEGQARERIRREERQKQDDTRELTADEIDDLERIVVFRKRENPNDISAFVNDDLSFSSKESDEDWLARLD